MKISLGKGKGVKGAGFGGVDGQGDGRGIFEGLSGRLGPRVGVSGCNESFASRSAIEDVIETSRTANEESRVARRFLSGDMFRASLFGTETNAFLTWARGARAIWEVEDMDTIRLLLGPS